MGQNQYSLQYISPSVAFEIKRLMKHISSMERFLENAPEGNLRISTGNGYTRFYRTTAEGNTVYLRKEEHALSRQLAQADYDRSVLPILRRKLKCLEEFQKLLLTSAEENAYDRLAPVRKALVSPTVIPLEDLIRAWKNEDTGHRPYGDDPPQILTENGELVVSKSEKIIADRLHSLGIPYQYEQKLVLQGFGTVYPDFRVLNTRTGKTYYYEHFGKMDDLKYLYENIGKINAYQRNGYLPGINLLFTFETSKQVIDLKVLNALIENYFL